MKLPIVSTPPPPPSTPSRYNRGCTCFSQMLRPEAAARVNTGRAARGGNPSVETRPALHARPAEHQRQPNDPLTQPRCISSLAERNFPVPCCEKEGRGGGGAAALGPCELISAEILPRLLFSVSPLGKHFSVFLPPRRSELAQPDGSASAGQCSSSEFWSSDLDVCVPCESCKKYPKTPYCNTCKPPTPPPPSRM